MKNKNPSTKRKSIFLHTLFVVSAAFLFIGILLIFGRNSSLRYQLQSFSPEADIPAYVSFETLYYGKQRIYLPLVLDENGVDGQLAQVLYTDSQRVWFSYTGSQVDTAKLWSIASVSLDGSDFKIHCSEQFQTDYFQPNTTGSYIGNYNSGSFYNGRIMLTDMQSVLVYDMHTESYQMMPEAESIYPKPAVKAAIMDHRKILLEWDGGKTTITPETLAQTSFAFSELMEHDGKRIWNGESKTKFLFSGVQCVGDDVYIICSIMNYTGETFVVVFRYDYLVGVCSYCFFKHNGDLYHGDQYVVPSK